MNGVTPMPPAMKIDSATPSSSWKLFAGGSISSS
jgi:hypothetical protein